ncbi:tryptophan-rich sensory protein [soil metagenome]
MVTVQNDRLKQILVIIATVGTIAVNWMAAVGKIGGVTPKEVSDKYFTFVTPAGYAFAIWSLIYAGLIAFSIYQALTSKAERFRNIRSIYILSCVANCAWIYFWHFEMITVCLAVIIGLWLTLAYINLSVRKIESVAETWLVATPFALYFGWVTVATILNFTIALKYLGIETSETVSTILACSFITIATLLGIIFRQILSNSAYPLAVAWALTAIGVAQSGKTVIVIFTAFGTIACLLSALSFVLKDKPRQYE